jgi:hypothetical protein
MTYHDVAWLDVSVKDPVPVTELEGGTHVSGDLESACGRDATLSRKDLFEALAVKKLHNYEWNVLTRPHCLYATIINSNDGMMVQGCHVANLAVKTLLKPAIPGEMGSQHFNRDIAAHAEIASLVNLGHVPIAKNFPNHIPVRELARSGH